MKKGIRELQNSQKTASKIALVSLYLSTVTLNVSGLNSLIQRDRVAEQIFKNTHNRTQLYTSTRDSHFSFRTLVSSKGRDRKHIPCK